MKNKHDFCDGCGFEWMKNDIAKETGLIPLGSSGENNEQYCINCYGELVNEPLRFVIPTKKTTSTQLRG